VHAAPISENSSTSTPLVAGLRDESINQCPGVATPAELGR
jgi:hypothetical protein